MLKIQVIFPSYPLLPKLRGGEKMAEITQFRLGPRCLTGQGFQALKEVQVSRFVVTKLLPLANCLWTLGRIRG